MPEVDAPSPDGSYRLGDVAASEQLIQDLYLSLRRKTRFWARLTRQTAQARMGYVGQHLVSVATGYQGGRSGARGNDLVHPDGSVGEIKTCYRVDQLGKCRSCSSGVSPQEEECPVCGSADLERKDDSKWLISVHNDREFVAVLVPTTYYFVLFDFLSIGTSEDIQASIWVVDPKGPGFVLCIVDYFLNIRAHSTSKAPFNLWPYSPKFEVMKPRLIYRSIIRQDDTIETLIFPGRDAPKSHGLNMDLYQRARFSGDVWSRIATRLGFDPATTKKDCLASIAETLRDQSDKLDHICDTMAVELYRSTVTEHLGDLPQPLLDVVAPILKK